MIYLFSIIEVKGKKKLFTFYKVNIHVHHTYCMHNMVIQTNNYLFYKDNLLLFYQQSPIIQKNEAVNKTHERK